MAPPPKTTTDMPGPRPAPDAVTLSPVSLRPPRVLVVDDHRDAAESTAMLLELAGCEVAVAYTGLEAIHRAHSFQPSIVLCDIGLPRLDGYAVARALRADPSLEGVRLIAVTGYGYETDKVRAGEAGFDEHLLKPVAPETFDRLLAPAPATPSFPERRYP